MKDRDLSFDRTCHVLYSKPCKKQIRQKIALHYPPEQREAVWEQVQLQYVAVLRLRIQKTDERQGCRSMSMRKANSLSRSANADALRLFFMGFGGQSRNRPSSNAHPVKNCTTRFPVDRLGWAIPSGRER